MAYRSKNHHYVPKVIQKEFCFRNLETWYAKRDKQRKWKTPELTITDDCFSEDNYYSVLDENDELSDVVETDYYGKVDGFLGRILPELLDRLKRGEYPKFSEESITSLRKAIFELIKRTPEFTQNYNEEKIGKEIVEESIKADPKLEAKLTKNDLSIRKQKEIGRTVRVQAVTETSEEIMSALSEFDVRWVVSDTKHSYVLSSLIAYRIGNGGSNGLLNPAMEIWMPISPKHVIVLTRDINRKIPDVYFDKPEHIRKVNEYAVENSRAVCSHSQQLLESLVQKKSRFGTMDLGDRGSV